MDYKEIIKHGINLKRISDIRRNLDDLIMLIETNNNKQLEKSIILKIKNEINKYHKNFIYKYSNIKNIYLYPEDNPMLYLYSIIVEFSKELREDLTLKDCLKFCKRITKCFVSKKGEHITLEDEIDIINIAQEKYKFLDIIKEKNQLYDIYNLPYTSVEECSNIMIREYKNKMVIELLLFNKNENDRNNTFIFATLLGRILNFALVDNPYEAPYGLMRFLKRNDIFYDENQKDGGPIIFASVFATALLFNTKYENFLNENEKEVGKLFDEYIKDVISKLRDEKKERTEEEISDNELCPCGSGKTYKNCCKKKRFQWIKDEDGNIKRTIPLDKKSGNAIKSLMDKSEKILNRKTKNPEKIFRYSIGPKFSENEMIRIAKKSDIPKEILYAWYKTGIPLSEMNIDLLPDYEYENWKCAIDEYYEIVNSNDKNHLNIIEYVESMNDLMYDTWNKYLDEATFLLTMFINDVKKDYFVNHSFTINNIDDFSVFLAARTLKNLEALYETLKKNYYEVSMSIVRMLYEDLININVYINNPDMFQKHIMPISLIEQGIFKRYVDEYGNVSNKSAINPKTNQKYNYSITLKDLSMKSDEKYKELYEELFRDLSSYTHLNISSRESYFRNPDPFFELDYCNIAGILGLFIINQIIYELSKIESISDFAYRDLLYFSDKVKEKLFTIFDILKQTEKKSNKLYEILQNCVSDYIDLK